jgi:hypothetical protein
MTNVAQHSLLRKVWTITFSSEADRVFEKLDPH